MQNVMMDVPHILLAVDDPDFALLIKLGFHESGILNPIRIVGDGRAAISYLNGEGQYSNRISFPLPALLLIDARLLHVPGFEVLRWIRQQPALSNIHTVLFSSLGSETDAHLAEEVGADYYLLKPFDFQDLVGIVRGLGVSWLHAESLPQMPPVPVSPGFSLCSPKQD